MKEHEQNIEEIGEQEQYTGERKTKKNREETEE